MRWETLKRYPVAGYILFMVGAVCALVLQQAAGTVRNQDTSPYLTPVAHDWYRFWYHRDGAFRMRYSESANERLRRVAAMVVTDARRQGFAFRMPILAQTTAAYHERIPLASEKPFIGDVVMGGFFPGANRIIISSGYMAELDDEMLYVLVAHELGHAVDLQNERVGHPSFGRWSDLSPDFFADSFAASLAGVEVVERFNRKYVGRRVVR